MRIPRLSMLCVLWGCCLLCTMPAAEFLDPDALLAVWDFNDPSNPKRSIDASNGAPLEFNGDAAYTSDRRGRSGAPGDRALDLGVSGSAENPTHAILVSESPEGSDLVKRLNTTNAEDQLSVTFWQRWQDGQIANSASVWFTSPSSGSGDRGFQAHVPWGNGTIYFDTSGCCDTPAKRLNGGITGIDWGAWHHVALIKKGGAKQVWVNGDLALDQASGADTLLTDWTGLVVGQSPTEPQYAFHGLVDDLGIFGVSLTEEQIKKLSSGSSPMDLAIPVAQQAPAIREVFPADQSEFHPIDGGLGFSVSTASPNEIPAQNIRLFLNGENVSASLNLSGTTTTRTATYSLPLESNQFYTAKAEASDDAGRSSSLEWTFDTFDPLEARADLPIDLARSGTAIHGPHNDSNNNAQLAFDQRSNTYSESPNVPGSFWEYRFEKPTLITRVEISPPILTSLAGVLQNTVLKAGSLMDQILYESTPYTSRSGGLWSENIPGEVYVQWVRLELPAGSTNALGDHRIAIGEIQMFGDPMPAIGPIQLDAIAVAIHEGAGSVEPAKLAIDGKLETFSQTSDTPGSQWLLTLDRTRAIHHIELVSPPGNASSRQLDGLLVEVLDETSLTVASAQSENPGSQGVWTFYTPPNTQGKSIRISLPDGSTNGAGNHIISLAEVMLFSSENFALNKDAYMVRLVDNLPPASNGNDGQYNTHTESTERTVDAYWETDLGTEKALTLVRVIPEDGFQRRMTHATVRLFDAAHDSIYSLHLGGTSEFFDVPLPGPINARYIRVGYENKERSDPPGVSWHLGLKELQAFGLNTSNVGLLQASIDAPEITSGNETTLTWQQEGLRYLTLYPAGISLGIFTEPNGIGYHTITPSQSIEYTFVGGLFGRTEVRHVTATVNQQPLPPRITEFMADNQTSMRDGFGDTSDWIELHNPNNTSLSLAGCGLSDDPDAPMKWILPNDTILEPHAYLVVFASSRSETRDTKGHLHANFSLNADGESIQLTAPDGTTVWDRIQNYPKQRHDLTFGRTLTGGWAFLEPTPEAANVATIYQGWLPPVEFSHTRGFQEIPINLTLSHPDETAQILFSTNGSFPSQAYTRPLRINGNASVRATVVRDGYKSPTVQTHSYLSVEDTLNASNMNRTLTGNASFAARIRKGLRDLPVISISVPELPDDWNEREASVEVFMPDDSIIQSNAGVKRFGGAWTDFTKKNYRLKFRPEYGNRKLELPLFEGFDYGIPAVDTFDEIDLRGGGHDMNSRGFYMSARFSEDTMLEMGALNPHGRFVHLYFNGEYWGQYHARERVTDAFLADYLGGQTEDYVNIRGNDNVGSSFVLGTPDPANRTTWENVLQFKGDYERVRHWVDIPHLIDFMLMWNLGNAETEYRAAGPVEAGTGFKFWLGDADGHIRSASDRTGNPGPADIFGALVSERHPDFMTLLADRIHLHLFNNGALTGDRNAERLRQRMEEIKDSLVAECARWGFRNPNDWERAANDAIEQILPANADQLRQRLERRRLYPTVSAPEFSQQGEILPSDQSIGIHLTSGDLYYTLDGSDPRLPGGNVSPTAQIRRANGASNATLVPPQSTWRYLDGGEIPGTGWASSTFDDSGWDQGNAPLGYGDEGMSTTLDFGGDSSSKAISYYFRQTFDASDPSGIQRLELNLVRDDGAVIYLNGREVARDNMPEGPVASDTRASSAAGGADETAIRTFNLPASMLREGANLIAVEVHQASPTSSDLRFDAWLQSATDASLSFSFPNDTHFKARAFDGRTWSALSEVFFFSEVPQPPQPGDILITEIQYNPDGPDEYEFIEILNRTTRALDLSNHRFADAITFTFPDQTHLAGGGIAVIVENVDAFAERYQDETSPYFHPNIRVIGQWSGRLSDAGERIQLWGANSTLITEVHFGDDNGWPELADGLGSSWELSNPLDLPEDFMALQSLINQPSSWSASSLFRGSPGQLELEPPLTYISITEEGAMQWTIQAAANVHLEIQTTENLAQPNWKTVDQFITIEAGPLEILLPIDKNIQGQFYRLIWTR
ncbi:MAG: lamin tail domain-containing protein [Verrucomicrobia bacterium]|nr:lamin tail domain-containing protein [Verrucomicrobiota bacterium]